MMEQPEVAVEVSGVGKVFKLPLEKRTSIKELFVHFFRRAKGYELQQALQDITFDVRKGEFLGIVGRNGSGKSTLLKIIAGIYQPTKGSVKVNGKLVPFIELGVGFNPELTGRENVYLNGALLGFSEKEIAAKYSEIVEFAELDQFMDQKLKNYSSGMQVRLAFSMAIRADADILLIDEVLAVGDAAFQRKCFEYFRNLKRDKKTVIFISHDMNAIREYCDRTIMIEDSRITAEGETYRVAMEYTKLFTEDKNKTVGSKIDHETEKRWGDGAIRYIKTIAKPKKLKDEKTLEIIAQAQAYENVETPIFGFSVKNSAGEYLLGTNTKIKGVKTKNVKPGDRINIHWTIPNIFADGKYYVNPAVERADGITECDWVEEAEEFSVFKEERTPYNITPDIKVVVD